MERRKIFEKVSRCTAVLMGAREEDVDRDLVAGNSASFFNERDEATVVVQETSSFVADIGMDSLDQVKILLDIEEAFDFEIPDEDMRKIKTVKDAVDYLAKALP